MGEEAVRLLGGGTGTSGRKPNAARARTPRRAEATELGHRREWTQEVSNTGCDSLTPTSGASGNRRGWGDAASQNLVDSKRPLGETGIEHPSRLGRYERNLSARPGAMTD
ncbi:hypothetical protein NDU88_004550 [Pleurodeles waltl]|uniref:Uncharacterized protein n=1 Tax=Pleurodeles waltl TaxID=8319 RepID=A0AAV7W8K5_PLEWA|nr:hypothetical protein NDU88_004550 [Pleurodeles waltl]